MVDVMEAEAGAREARTFAKKRLLVASGKGGSSKTTTARHFSTAAAHAGLAVVTLDLDESPTLSTWWTKRPDTLPSIEHIRAPIHELVDLSDVDVEGEDVGAVIAARVEKEILGIEDYDLLIIDTPASMAAYPHHANALIRASDLVVVPTRQYDDDINSVTSWMKLVRDLGVDGMFLLSDTQRRESAFEDAKRKLVKHGPLCPIDIPHFADIPKTLSKGTSVIDMRRGRGREDYAAAFDVVRQKLGV
ncbi:ParA family protein [Azospirillum ramasamyi]|nr:ParA family protein [Azospirillum ramasamyi]